MSLKFMVLFNVVTHNNPSCLLLQLSLPNQIESIEARCWDENEDVVGAAPAGDAPTTSEWSTILPTKVPLVLEIWQ